MASIKANGVLGRTALVDWPRGIRYRGVGYCQAGQSIFTSAVPSCPRWGLTAVGPAGLAGPAIR